MSEIPGEPTDQGSVPYMETATSTWMEPHSSRSSPRLIVNAGIDLDAGSAVLSKMTIDELKTELSRTISITARHLVHIADVWQELLRRGEDLSALRSGLWKYMPLIASGELQPELVVRYAGNSRLLRRLAALPRYEQDIILNNDMVIVAERESGSVSFRTVRVGQLTSKEIRQVFRDRIMSRTDQEQMLVRRDRLNSKPFPEDLRKQVLRGAFLRSRKELKTRVRRSFSIELSIDEWSVLEDEANEAGVSVSSIVASALRAISLI